MYMAVICCSEHVDVTLVSPRNYFLYTPLLPAAATGTVEERSIVEPVRKMLGNKVDQFATPKRQSPKFYLIKHQIIFNTSFKKTHYVIMPFVILCAISCSLMQEVDYRFSPEDGEAY